MTVPTPDEIQAALQLGPATPDALAGRLGGADRDALLWAVDELIRDGVVASTAAAECGPDGICGTSVPTVFSLATPKSDDSVRDDHLPVDTVGARPA